MWGNKNFSKKNFKSSINSLVEEGPQISKQILKVEKDNVIVTKKSKAQSWRKTYDIGLPNKNDLNMNLLTDAKA